MRTPTPTGVDETNTTADKIIYFSTSTRPASAGIGAYGAAISGSATRAALDSRGSFIDAPFVGMARDIGARCAVRPGLRP